MHQACPSGHRSGHEHIRIHKQYPRGPYPTALGGNQRIVQQRILQTIKTVLDMTQIVFQAAAIACCIYTAYRIVILMVRKSRKKDSGPQRLPASSDGTADVTEPDNGHECVSASPVMECIEEVDIRHSLIIAIHGHLSGLQACRQPCPGLYQQREPCPYQTFLVRCRSRCAYLRLCEQGCGGTSEKLP